ncbi:MAG TPA: crossover junction endodeoxyribonuclease RuvC [Myxococcaceae bacterium]|nr:crossover junction endodeoxyribonuclease RuvC [Myxococcaceae bacterium]
MRVIGIDPGSRSLGYGVVEERRGRLVHVAHGVIRASPHARLEQRLQRIFSALLSAIALHRPDAAAVEGVFAFRNPRSALILGQARGVALLVAAQRGLAVHEYAPARVKRSVGAGGASDKEAVARMVNGFLGLPQPPSADASDALAVAICHLNHARFGRVQPQSTPARKAAAGFADRLKPAYRRVEARGG